MRRFRTVVALLAFLLVFDLLSKQCFAYIMPLNVHYNPGIALSIMRNWNYAPLFFGLLNSIVGIGIIVYLRLLMKSADSVECSEQSANPAHNEMNIVKMEVSHTENPDINETKPTFRRLSPVSAFIVKYKHQLMCFALVLVGAGALGNAFDRVINLCVHGYAYVTDFINYGVFVGNIADIYICIGAVMLCVLFIMGTLIKSEEVV